MMVVLVSMLALSTVQGQGFGGKNRIILIGQVTNNINGAPLKEQAILIVSDSIYEPQFTYLNKVVTDFEGFFYDTIYTNQSKGALIVQTEDYMLQSHDTTVYYRFEWSEDNILFANFKLPVPPISNNFQANFNFENNPNGTNPKEYQFFDLSAGSEIISWNWDFGDGTHSSLQNPSHVFEEPGLYRVKLTVNKVTGSGSTPLVSTIVKLVNVVTKSYFHMGGQVFAGYFPIDKAEVFLYKLENSNYVPIDTAIFNDDIGAYYFYHLIEGDYIIKSDLHPSSELFNQIMTTYYNDKLHWYEADTIHHHSSYYQYDINLVPNDQAMYGPGTIVGKITCGSGGSKTYPAENISILLFDENNQPMDICHSNSVGDFELDNLDLQVYSVYAEVTGKNTYPVTVILDESGTGQTIVNIFIGDNFVNGSVNAGTDENHLESGISQVYPNPANHRANISIKLEQAQTINYEVINQAGQTVITSQFKTMPGSILTSIDISDLTNGMYFLKLNDEMNNTVIRKLIKK